MRIEISKEWKERTKNEIEKNKKIRDEKFEEYLKTFDNRLRGSIDFYEKEIEFLKGKLFAIELIEQGCYVEGVNTEVNIEANAF